MSDPTVEVRGRAGTDVEPEYVVLTTELEAGGETARAAQRRIDDRLAEFTVALPATVGEGDRHVTGRSVDTTEELFDTALDDAFVARATLELRCDELPVDDVAVAVAAAGGSVTRTEPRVTEERREAIRAELLTAATENAREQAEHVAAAEGHTVGSAVSLSTEESLGFESIVDEALASAVSADHDPGPIEFTAGVSAVFELDG